jgi:CheY-like chemotaxis protein
MNLLIVDDDKVILDLLAEMLSGLAYVITTTNDPKHALELFRQAASEKNPFDVVLTDFQMPYWSGLTLAMHIASCCTVFEIKAPVICITCNASDVRRMNERDRGPLALIMEKGSFGMCDLDNAIKCVSQRAKTVGA